MIALIVAYANNQVIGNKGRIPWKIKGEQKRFKELTTGNVKVKLLELLIKIILGMSRFL